MTSKDEDDAVDNDNESSLLVSELFVSGVVDNDADPTFKLDDVSDEFDAAAVASSANGHMPRDNNSNFFNLDRKFLFGDRFIPLESVSLARSVDADDGKLIFIDLTSCFS